MRRARLPKLAPIYEKINIHDGNAYGIGCNSNGGRCCHNNRRSIELDSGDHTNPYTDDNSGD